MNQRLSDFFGHVRPLLKPVAVAALGWAAFAPATAQAPELGMLDKVRTGLWEIKTRGSADAPDRVCIRDNKRLLQIRHLNTQCSRFVIEDEPRQVTVSYSCSGGAGHGRTTLIFEDTDLLRINTQGIAENSPFSYSAEARRVGNCG